jgi:hypothetical protein
MVFILGNILYAKKCVNILDSLCYLILKQSCELVLPLSPLS